MIWGRWVFFEQITLSDNLKRKKKSRQINFIKIKSVLHKVTKKKMNEKPEIEKTVCKTRYVTKDNDKDLWKPLVIDIYSGQIKYVQRR